MTGKRKATFTLYIDRGETAMMEIVNNCPICGSNSLMKFRASDRDDLPDGPWAVPCTACQAKILEALSMIGCNRDAVKMQAGLLISCQTGNAASICIAKNLVAVAENALTDETA